ncbi:MAG: GNAT family N-acetyltransferase [Caulobacteraceae bacterium]
MTEAFVVRPVRREDREQWAALWQGYNAFYGRAGPTALDPAVTEATWTRFFDPAEPVRALVAEADGGLVGLTHYLFHSSTTAIAPICYLSDLYTSEAARGRGVGGALIEAVYVAARAAGAFRVYWQTQETNLAARSLYDKLAARTGFIVYAQAL